jgi:hypothetical protein
MNMKASQLLLIIVSVCAVAVSAAQANVVTVSISGTVEYNQIPAGYPLHVVTAGQPASLSFTVDSNNYTNSPSYPTRGYPIDIGSFHLNFPTISVALQNPFPSGEKPYFVIRHNDPQVDGFLVSTSYDYPLGVPTDQAGGYGQLVNEFHVTYQHGTLPSLNILDAAGTYDYAGLTVFNWALQDGPFDPLYIDFVKMSISPEPATLVLLAIVPLVMIRRR